MEQYKCETLKLRKVTIHKLGEIEQERKRRKHVSQNGSVKTEEGKKGKKTQRQRWQHAFGGCAKSRV